MRYRTRNESTSTQAKRFASDASNASDSESSKLTSPGTLYPYSGATFAYRSSISDLVSPGTSRLYKPCIQNSARAGFVSDSRIISFPDSYGVHVPDQHRKLKCWLMYDPVVTVPSGPWGELLDDLASQANGSLSEAASLPVTLLEGAKTIAMIRNPFNLLKPNFHRSVRKLSARALAVKGANVWLEGYYGWKSMYQDVMSLSKATANLLHDSSSLYFDKLGKRLCARKSDTQFSSRTDYVLGTTEPAWQSMAGRGWRNSGMYYLETGDHARLVNHSLKHAYTLGCRQVMQVSDRLRRTKAFLAQYGARSWSDIRDVIWEVIPFSFVVDWFIDTRGIWAPINQWRLNQLDIKQVGHSTRSSGEYNIELYDDPNAYANGGSQKWTYKYAISVDKPTSLSTTGKYCSYVRTPGFPSVDVVYAKFLSKGLKFIQGVNGAALLAQVIFKPKR